MLEGAVGDLLALVNGANAVNKAESGGTHSGGGAPAIRTELESNVRVRAAAAHDSHGAANGRDLKPSPDRLKHGPGESEIPLERGFRDF